MTAALPPAPPGYRILALLGSGGMADLYLAQRLGAGGVTKTVALKRVRADFASDPEFVRMFLNEARIAVDLSHGNITSVFELAEAGGAHYLVMDYVRGWDLARVLGACAEGRVSMPVALALHVAIEVLKALGHAHDRKDAEGRPMGIVHRDVSPPNVLLSVDGAVMLTDFGIARAAASASSTSLTWLKGKIPYMSPEQARAAPLDGRSDLFSLGVVLFEMLTTRRLFQGVEETRLLEAVREARVPRPSSIRVGIPPEVDALVLRALAADPSRRFQSAREMQAALGRALGTLDPEAGSEQLAGFLRGLGMPPPPDPLALARDEAARPVTLPPPAAEPARARTTSPDPAPGRRARLASAAVLCAVLAFGGAAALRRATAGSVQPAPAPSVRLEVRSGTPGASLRIDGEPRGPLPAVLRDLERRPVEVRVEREGYVPWVQRVDLGSSPDVVIDAPLDPVE